MGEQSALMGQQCMLTGYAAARQMWLKSGLVPVETKPPPALTGTAIRCSLLIAPAAVQSDYIKHAACLNEIIVATKK